MDEFEVYKAYTVQYDNELRQLPSSQPKQKKGRWIIYVISPFDGEDCRCSECGQIECAPYWNYCPNCGAVMKGEQYE